MPEKLMSTLSAQPEGARVAVVTLLGSLCPITRGHKLAFVEARRLLLGEEDVKRPARLEKFDEVLGLVSLNGDNYVGRKLAKKGLANIDVRERRMLVELAVADVPWMTTEKCEGSMVHELQKEWPLLQFTHIIMNGADDVRRHRKWTWTDSRMIAMGRPGDTEFVVNAATRDGIDLEAGGFIMGPELPDISSSEAREALGRNDVAKAAEMLHPDVLAWCLEHGPWRPAAASTSAGAGAPGRK